MTRASPRVTVVIPIFNAEQFLAETIDSVLSQTYSDWEAILVDDGSTDDSLRVAGDYAAQHSDWIRVVQHPGGANRGVCASRNLGVRLASGELIALLDADDVWLPAKLQDQVAIIDEHPSAEMVFGHTCYWRTWDHSDATTADNIPSFDVEVDRLYPPKALNLLLYPFTKRTAPNPSDLLLRKELVLRVGGFEERFHGKLQLYEDQAFLSKVYLSAPVFISSKTWIRYRLHPSSFYAQRIESERPALFLDFLEWFESYLSELGETDPQITSMVQEALFPYRHPRLHRLAVKLGKRSPEIAR